MTRRRNRRTSLEDLPPWKRTIRKDHWARITGKGPERDHLLLVWREGEDRNRFFLVPCGRIPDAWAEDLPELEDLYLDLEAEDGNDDQVTRLLGLVYCAVSAVPRLDGITYRGVSWPIPGIIGMWGKYLISPDDVDPEQVGMVICAGVVAPPEMEEG